MSDRIDEIMAHVQADSEVIQNIKRNLEASHAMIAREQKAQREETKEALALSKRNLKRVRKLCYIVKEVKHDIATERHRIDDVKRDVLRIPETCHKGASLVAHLQAHANNKDDKKIRISLLALVPGFIAIVLSIINLIKGAA